MPMWAPTAPPTIKILDPAWSELAQVHIHGLADVRHNPLGHLGGNDIVQVLLRPTGGGQHLGDGVGRFRCGIGEGFCGAGDVHLIWVAGEGHAAAPDDVVVPNLRNGLEPGGVDAPLVVRGLLEQERPAAVPYREGYRRPLDEFFLAVVAELRPFGQALAGDHQNRLRLAGGNEAVSDVHAAEEGVAGVFDVKSEAVADVQLVRHHVGGGRFHEILGDRGEQDGVHVLGFHAGFLHGDLPRSGGDVGAQLLLGCPVTGGTAGEHLAQAELHAVVFVSGHLLQLLAGDHPFRQIPADSFDPCTHTAFSPSMICWM